MSYMPIVDENGLIVVETGSLKPVESNHPAYKARNDVALPQGAWLYAPADGHDLDKFKNAKATQANAEEFEKSARFYLNKYGADVISRLIKRGQASFDINITKDPLNGTSV